MAGIESILEHVRLLIVQHVPSDALKQAVPFALVCLVAGIGLSVFGAKLSRFGFVGALAVVGGAAGAFVARQTGYPTPVCGLIGALMAGVTAFYTFRFWVGIAAAGVLCVVALGLFGYRNVVPHVAAFNQTVLYAADAGGSFALPTPGQQQQYVDRTPKQWASELWSFVTRQDGRLEGKARAVALAAMLTGLCLGVVAMRTALIVSTSLVGTALVTTGMAALLTQSVPATSEAFQQRPGLVGIGVGGFLMTSLIVQTLLTRKAPSPKPAPATKS